jgi:hypothetical protein
MSNSPAPDVERVLNRMGRAAFDYRSFPNPVDELGSAAPPAPPPGADAAAPPSAALFSLVGDALPGAARASVAPPAAEPAPMIAPAAITPAAIAPPPPNPFLLGAQEPPDRPAAAKPRSLSLAEMFRILSGDAGAMAPRGDAFGPEPVFPFRRR